MIPLGDFIRSFILPLFVVGSIAGIAGAIAGRDDDDSISIVFQRMVAALLSLVVICAVLIVLVQVFTFINNLGR